MKVRIYGFSLNNKKQECVISYESIFDALMEGNGATNLGKLYQCSAAKLDKVKDDSPDQYGGIFLRFRDAKSYTKYSQQGGKIRLSSETLDPDEKLAEISFFVVNKETGRGLITYYQHSPSIHNLGYISQKVFSKIQKDMRSKIDQNDSLTKKEKSLEKKRIAGKIDISQLCRTEDLKSLVKKLKKAISFEIQFENVKTRESLFRGIITNSEKQTMKFFMSDSANVIELAEEAGKLAESEEVKELKIVGKDSQKQNQTYKKTDNALTFESYEYDSFFGEIDLDLSDWATSTKQSDVIKRLQALTQSKSNKVLLE